MPKHRFDLGSGQRGLALTTIAIYIIAFFSLTVILLFINNPLRQGAEGLYCSVQSQFGDKPAFCDSSSCQGEEVELEVTNKEEVAMEIAAHSIACLKGKSGCSRGENIVCYSIKLDDVEAVTERNVTDALKQGGGCPVLPNNKIVLPDGSRSSYSNCGREDKLKWRVSDNIIKEQSRILIEYNYQNHTILVEGYQ